MQAHCKLNGHTNFELVVRLSDEGKQTRWDDALIQKVATDHSDLKKIWVCGPPNLTETFSHAFMKLEKENIISKSQYEVI